MSEEGVSEGQHNAEEALLEADSRWALVQRIAVSEGFERATQLRKILLYASRIAILRPNDTLSEYDVAHNILGRRPDFHPSSDNIVRAQFSHLRNRLRQYFDTVGVDEPVVLKIPKGSYLPVFTPGQKARESAIPVSELGENNESFQSYRSLVKEQAPHVPVWRRWKTGWFVLLNLVCLLLIFLGLRSQSLIRPEALEGHATNPFIQFLAGFNGEVTVVMPDTSLLLIQGIVDSNISVSDYLNHDFPQRQMAAETDPDKRAMISSLGTLRTTSVNEALIAFDLVDTLKQSGVHAKVRYARDLHVQDFNEGNSILIGGPNSDPWVSLFTDRTNFRHIDDLENGTDYFENLHPESGEQSRYKNDSLGYVDVVLTENPSHSGYVLLINGADFQANEAAARFLAHGHLPSDILSVLSSKSIRTFEFFLRGKHMAGEADSSFELVALRKK